MIWNGSASGVNLNKFDNSQKPVWRAEIRENMRSRTMRLFLALSAVLRATRASTSCWRRSKHSCKKQRRIPLIVGNPELSAAVDMSLYQWAQEQAHTIFCGRTSTVETYLAAMDAYILPSYREGFGMVVVEAEAMGVPVIVTDIPGPTDAMIPDETGLVVKKRTWILSYPPWRRLPLLRKRGSASAWPLISLQRKI